MILSSDKIGLSSDRNNVVHCEVSQNDQSPSIVGVSLSGCVCM